MAAKGKERVDVSLYLRLVEGKDMGHGEVDTYATVLLNHRLQLKSKTIYASENPLWDEDILFEPQEDFEQVDVIVWESGRRFANDRPLGKIVLAADALGSGSGEQRELWMPLQSAAKEGTVTGEVQLTVKLSPPMNSEATLTVTVISGTNLVAADVNGSSDPYVSVQVLPDPEANSTKLTKYKKRTLNPKYNETFTFPVPCPGNRVPANAKMHLSVWDWDRFTHDDFMGFAELRLDRLPFNESVNRVLGLRPMPPSFKEQGGVAVVADDAGGAAAKPQKIQRERSTNGLPSPAMARRYVRDYQTQASTLATTPTENAELGSVRIKYKYSVQTVLDADAYKPFIEAISANKFQLPVVLGKVSNEREDAAWAIVRLFQYLEVDGCSKCIVEIAKHEVQSTTDANTIFRGNSMASKAIDVYMKMIGLQYIKDTIGDLIKAIILSKHSFELDPTRLDKPEDAKKNLANLISTVTAFVNAIFASADAMPPGLARVFSGLRTAVKEAFPENDTVSYTVISGFLFLRLFVAATMTPVLFGLWHEHVDKGAARSLTLVAKTLQNLANLVPFGQKEPFMTGMNDLILARIPDMKTFIEEASAATTNKGQPRWTSSANLQPSQKKASAGQKGGCCGRKRSINDVHELAVQRSIADIDVAKEASKLFHHFLRNRERIVAEATTELVPEQVMAQLAASLDKLGPLHALPNAGRSAAGVTA